MKLHQDAKKFPWLQSALLLAAVVVFNLLTDWVNGQEGALDIGLQLNLVMTCIFLFGCFLLLRGRLRDIGPWELTALLGLLGLTLLMRLGMIWVKTFDYNEYFYLWMAQMQQYEGFEALAAEISNYNMPYVYLLFLIAKLRPLQSLFYIKAFSIIFDLLMAYAVSRLIGTVKKSRIVQSAAFFITLALPTVILNSACWGQLDAILTSLALLGLLFGLERKSVSCYVLFGLALSVKLQAVFLLPMVIILVICKRIRFRDCWAFFAAYLATLIPALLAGRDLVSLLGIYAELAGAFPGLTLNAPSMFAWMPNVMIEMRYLGLGLAFMSCLGLILYCGMRRDRLNNQMLLEAALLFCLVLPFFLPHMHERYNYCAEILAVVYLFVGVGQPRWPISSTVWISGLFSYFPFLFSIQAPVSQGLMATALAFVGCCLATRFVKHVEQGAVAAPVNMEPTQNIAG